MRGRLMQIHAVGREPPSLPSDSEFWMGRERDKGNETASAIFVVGALVVGTRNAKYQGIESMHAGLWGQERSTCNYWVSGTNHKLSHAGLRREMLSHGLATKYPIP
jgi:hypothetical protein